MVVSCLGERLVDQRGTKIKYATVEGKNKRMTENYGDRCVGNKKIREISKDGEMRWETRGNAQRKKIGCQGETYNKWCSKAQVGQAPSPKTAPKALVERKTGGGEGALKKKNVLWIYHRDH